MPFNCTSCGACCKRIRQVAEMFKDNEELRFPHKIDEAGNCEMLDENNRCSIYDTRPTICNIDKMQQFTGIPKDKFYAMNIKACNKMILQDGLDKKYLIKE